MATEKQKKAIINAVENGGNVSKAMRDAGYSIETARNPSKLTESVAWDKLMKKNIPDDSLASLHNRFLNKQEIVVKNNNDTKKLETILTEQPHPDALKALDLAYKLKGKYSPEKKEITLKDFDSLLDEIDGE